MSGLEPQFQPKKKDVGRSPIHIDLKHLFASVFSAKSPEAPLSIPKGAGQEGKRACPATLLRYLSRVQQSDIKMNLQLLVT